MSFQDRIRHVGPVALAGLSFLALGAILITCGRAFTSSALAGLGSELAFDGCYYLGGGILSRLLARSRFHFLRCWSRETLELIALLAGTAFFTLGALLQPNSDTSRAQMVAGLVLAPIAIGLNAFWHPRLENPSDGHRHTGFSTHMVIDAITAVMVGSAGIFAFTTGEPQWNTVFAWLVIVVAVAVSIRPAATILRRMAHRPGDHQPRQSLPHSHR